MKIAETAIHPVDRHVGARMRLRRRMMGMSQQDLSGAIGLTFQQLQKYEKGTNRISASKLHGVACALKVPVGYFFEGLGDDAEGPSPEPERTAQTFLATKDGFELADAFPRIRSGKWRRTVLELVRGLAEDQ